MISREKCYLEHPIACKGRIEIHHIDGNPCNNSIKNLVAVCKTHHNFLDEGTITLEDPEIPSFYIDGSGKRRYNKKRT
jgi:hypothetical protein